MYVDVMSELVRLFVYLLYFVIIFTFYGIPLPIIRDLWTSFRVSAATVPCGGRVFGLSRQPWWVWCRLLAVA